MQTRVVNLKKEKYDVYIGRAGKGCDGYFGNPFRLEEFKNRLDCINKYKEYFYNRIKNDREFHKRIISLRGKILGCFCDTHYCHGNIICDYLNYRKHREIIAIVGSRNFDDYEFLESILRRLNIDELVSGGAIGADKLANEYALKNKIPILEILPDYNRYGSKQAPIMRNKEIVNECNELIAFWDGKSPGTRSSIKFALDQRKPVHIYRF